MSGIEAALIAVALNQPRPAVKPVSAEVNTPRPLLSRFERLEKSASGR